MPLRQPIDKNRSRFENIHLMSFVPSSPRAALPAGSAAARLYWWFAMVLRAPSF